MYRTLGIAVVCPAMLRPEYGESASVAVEKELKDRATTVHGTASSASLVREF
jgi:hypothetical protein